MAALAWGVLDTLLIAAVLALAWASLASKDLRRAVVLFVAFGLLLALVWVRLRAPDIALAEAAIGSGLTGALLLAALGDEPQHEREALADASSWGGDAMGPRLLLTVLCTALGLVLGGGFVYALQQGAADRLADAVFSNLQASGVSNPVTAVLLNFRAYDTLLELAVLLAAVLGIIALGPARPGMGAAGPVLTALARWLVPILVLVSGYLLWAGAHAPGGAFQAGALLAAAGVLLRLAGYHHAGLPRAMALRVLTIVGVAVFLMVGLGVMIIGQPFLGYPLPWAGSLILAIETAATLGIAATLVIAFLCGEADGVTPLSQRPADSGGPHGQPGSEPSDAD